MNSARVYLDHNATSPWRPEARAAVEQALAGPPLGNPSSAHAEGRRARALLERAREQLADLLGCPRDGLVFTSGGTEANALALASCRDTGALAVSAVEHPSLLETALASPRGLVVPVDSRGRPDTSVLPADTALLSVSTANHETGHVQDVEALTQTIHNIGGLFHTDGCQALGRVSFRPFDAGSDLASVCAHKLGGPVGIGVLAARELSLLRPLVRGGGQEADVRPGTEAVVLAVAFAAAARAAVDALPHQAPHWRELIQRTREGVRQADPTAVFHSDDRDGLPNTLAVSFPGRHGQALVHRLDLEGCAVSHGSACASGSLRPSPVLLALGAGDDAARSVLRISLGHDTTRDDVQRFVSALRATLADNPTHFSPKKPR
ncbi:MAG: cysteine desulfurase [Planctomycetota bacterium]|nr:MAG: cysteine desulfurase [Planctomycetota bacterium]